MAFKDFLGAVKCPDCDGETVDWDDWFKYRDHGMLYLIVDTGIMFSRLYCTGTEDGL